MQSNAREVPLTGYVNQDVYKTIFMDIGFVNHYNQIDLINLGDLITANEGMLAEQFIGQEIISMQKSYLNPELFYWSLLSLPLYMVSELDRIINIKLNIHP